MTSIWNWLEDTSIGGKYSLHELLGESEGGAFFRTTFGPDQQTGGLKLIVETSTAAGEEQLTLWRIAARIAHPNLLRLLDYGRTEEEGHALLHAVFEFPDDSLASALERGPLSVKETREVLVAALDGLRYIHAEGLVHAAVDASHVVAVGDQIKLSTDTLRRPSSEAATAEDVRSLGALVYQLLTGRRVEPGTAPDLSSVPEPFRGVIQHSLANDPSQRWSLTEISASLNPAAGQIVDTPESGLQTPRANRSRPFPKWILVATPAFLIVVILLFRGITPGSEATVPVPSVQSPVAQSLVVPRLVPQPNWRVIAYTYPRRAEAEKRAQRINRKWSGARAEVFEPSNAKSGTYLVALGGAMSRDEALRYLKIARGKGMPRGTYIRSYLP